MEDSISVFQYTDFQTYLRDWFEMAKQTRRGISLQTVSTKLGLRSRSHLHRILHDAKPPCSENLAQRLSEILDLRPREQEYFLALVDFNRAETLTQKNDAYRRMHALLAMRDLSPLKPDRFAYFSDWILPTLREVAVFPGLKGNPDAMGRCFEPPLSTTQVERGLELLTGLGFLQKDSKGHYQQANPIVDSGDDLISLAIYNFQLETLALARAAMDTLDPSAYPDSLPSQKVIAQVPWDAINALLGDSISRSIKVDTTLNNANFWQNASGAFVNPTLQEYRILWVPFELDCSAATLMPSSDWRTQFYPGYQEVPTLPFGSSPIMNITTAENYAIIRFFPLDNCGRSRYFLMQKSAQGTYSLLDFWPKTATCKVYAVP